MFRSMFCIVIAMAPIVGCGGGDSDIPLSVQGGQQAAETTNTGAAATAPAPQPGQHVLVGNWKGNLIASPEQLAEIKCTAVTLELEFAASGEMAMLATMHGEQGTEESSGIATWAVVKEEGNVYTIQSKESETEVQELEVEMPDPNTLVVKASDGGQFKLARQ